MERKKGCCRACVLAAALAVLLLLSGCRAEDSERVGLEMAEKLGAGFCIGNDLDAYGITRYRPDAQPRDFESYWGNVPVTPEVFTALREAGFSSVRIPVSWSEHMDGSGTVDAAWMDRVQEVVDQALDAGLYAILNTHHEPFIIPDDIHADTCAERLETLWRQIAERFKGYDERLLFEGMNEPRMQGTDEEWTAGSAETQRVVNRLNEVFVQTVRRGGGKNAKRFLLVTAYASSHRTEALAALTLPEGDRRVLVSVHAYLPYLFTQAESGMENWNADSSRYTTDINRLRDDVRRLFLERNVGVVITEFSCRLDRAEEARFAWAQYFVDTFAALGVPRFWWDNGIEFRILDRENASFDSPELVRILTRQ